jgi:transposase
MSQSAIARTLGLDRKTVRKYLRQAPAPYARKERAIKLEPFLAYLRERWEQGVHNAAKLLGELRQRGYQGGYSRLREIVGPWRQQERERAFVRFETAPGEQAQMDWSSFGNALGARLYAFALTLSYSRYGYLEFTQRQDMETLLNCLVHAFHYFGGVPRSILTDNMKTVVLDRLDGQVRFHPRFLDFASYYGVLPQVCHPYRPQTKGKIESALGYVKKNFWPGIDFHSLADLNQQARLWLEAANGRKHGTTGEIPRERFLQERLLAIDRQPDYDTSYVTYREVAKDCLLSYRGNRYSVPHRYAGKRVVVRQAVDGELLRVYHQQELIAAHPLASGKHQMVVEAEHYRGLPNLKPAKVLPPPEPVRHLVAGPGVGHAFPVPEVEYRALDVYEQLLPEVDHVATV